MATTYSKFLYGWQVTSSNQALPFDRGGNKDATLRVGVYDHGTFATEVARAMNAADTGQTYTCAFSTSTDKFTIANGAAFVLEFSRNASTNCNGLLGFDDADTASATSHESASAAGAGFSTMTSWTMADPNTFHTPVTAQAGGAACLRGERVVRTVQNKSDGGTVDTVYFGTDKIIQIAFDMLTSAEATKMEALLDWMVQGRRFTWQPDSTATAYVTLVMVDPSQATPAWSWLTRSEVSYGTLKFIEQVSRT